MFGVTVIGLENLRQVGRFIIIANHNSHLDICLLFSMLKIADISRTHAVADRAYFSSSRLLFNFVTFLFNTVWVNRGDTSRESDPLGQLKSLIDDGHNLIIFPEGTRGKPGELEHFRSGIGRLIAQYLEVPVVPVFLMGPERALPKKSVVPLPFWNTVIIGPPQVCRGSHREITQTLEHVLAELARSETARRHQRMPVREKAEEKTVTVAFLGIDGSGKSTISRMTAMELSESCRVCLISDRLELYKQGNLSDYQPLVTEKIREALSRYAKKAQSLKLYKIPKLAELLLRDYLRREVKRWYLADVIVLDGSPLLNMVAWAGLYREKPMDDETYSKAIAVLTGGEAAIGEHDPIYTQFPELTVMKRLKLTGMELPDAVAFIDVSPRLACNRIDARGEQKQVHETEEKLKNLRVGYNMVCDTIKRRYHVPMTVLNGEDTQEHIVSAALDFILSSLALGE